MGGRADTFFRWLEQYPSFPESDFKYPSGFQGTYDPNFYYLHDGRYYGPIAKVDFAEEFPQFIFAPCEVAISHCPMNHSHCVLTPFPKVPNEDTLAKPASPPRSVAN